MATTGGPVGRGDYVVQAGDCMESIAAAHGHVWQTLWDLPENAELKQKRGDPNVLLAGDRVTIPPPRAKEHSGATGQRHKFRRKGAKSRLQLKLANADGPRANESYTLEIGGRLLTGTTDGDGKIDIEIPPDAKVGHLTVGEKHDEYVLHLGHLDPVDTVGGAQGRLKSLGYYAGPVDGTLSAETRAAIVAFQSRNDLTVTGEMDQATCDKLKQLHGA